MTHEMTQCVKSFDWKFVDLQRVTVNALKSSFIPFEERLEIIEKVALHPLTIFLQVSLDGAHHRGGAGVDQLYQLAEKVCASNSHTLAGLMSVPPVGVAPDEAYSQLALIRNEFLVRFPHADQLSAGMSGDYQSAISHGATHVRVGSSILGSRSPHR